MKEATRSLWPAPAKKTYVREYGVHRRPQGLAEGTVCRNCPQHRSKPAVREATRYVRRLGVWLQIKSSLDLTGPSPVAGAVWGLKGLVPRSCGAARRVMQRRVGENRHTPVGALRAGT